jgi:hypothetical protein
MNQLRSNAAHACAIAQLASKFTIQSASQAFSPSHISKHHFCPVRCSSSQSNQQHHDSSTASIKQTNRTNLIVSQNQSEQSYTAVETNSSTQLNKDNHEIRIQLQNEWRQSLQQQNLSQILKSFIKLQPHTQYNSKLQLRQDINRQAMKSYMLTRDQILIQFVLYILEQYYQIHNTKKNNEISKQYQELTKLNSFVQQFDLYRSNQLKNQSSQMMQHQHCPEQFQ